jgi:osmotically-inducible protein OsmY
MNFAFSTGRRAVFLMLTTLGAGIGLSACAPLVIGSAVGSAIMVTDRRTSGTQIEDEAIELKATKRVGEVLGDRGGRVSATSYNRLVLLTGQVPADGDRAAVEQAVARIENVKTVVNELTVGFTTGIGTRSNDLLLTSKVKATFVDAKDVQANAFKVVTEAGVVYLMGRVTQREADRATELARGISGVQKVVRVFEVVSESELAGKS